MNSTPNFQALEDHVANLKATDSRVRLKRFLRLYQNIQEQRDNPRKRRNASLHETMSNMEEAMEIVSRIAVSQCTCNGSDLTDSQSSISSKLCTVPHFQPGRHRQIKPDNVYCKRMSNRRWPHQSITTGANRSTAKASVRQGVSNPSWPHRNAIAYDNESTANTSICRRISNPRWPHHSTMARDNEGMANTNICQSVPHPSRANETSLLNEEIRSVQTHVGPRMFKDWSRHSLGDSKRDMTIVQDSMYKMHGSEQAVHIASGQANACTNLSRPSSTDVKNSVLNNLIQNLGRLRSFTEKLAEDEKIAMMTNQEKNWRLEMLQKNLSGHPGREMRDDHLASLAELKKWRRVQFQYCADHIEQALITMWGVIKPLQKSKLGELARVKSNLTILNSMNEALCRLHQSLREQGFDKDGCWHPSSPASIHFANNRDQRLLEKLVYVVSSVSSLKNQINHLLPGLKKLVNTYDRPGFVPDKIYKDFSVLPADESDFEKHLNEGVQHLESATKEFGRAVREKMEIMKALTASDQMLCSAHSQTSSFQVDLLYDFKEPRGDKEEEWHPVVSDSVVYDHLSREFSRSALQLQLPPIKGDKTGVANAARQAANGNLTPQPLTASQK